MPLFNPVGAISTLAVSGNGTVTGTLGVTGALTASGGVTSTGNIVANAGNVVVNTAGKGLQVKEGANATMGTLTLNGATPVVVSTTAVTANSRIFLTTQLVAGTPATYGVTARSAGTSFSVTGVALDTSTVGWLLVEPA